MGVLIVRDEWIQDFELMGNDLLIYARLYSFTQNVGCYAGSMEWLAQSVGIKRITAIRAINNLIDKNLIKKEGKNIKCFVYDAELEPDPENEPILYQKDTKMYQKNTKMYQKDTKLSDFEVVEGTPENKLYQKDTLLYQNDTPVYQNDTQIINIKENQKIKGGGECAHTHARTHEGEGSAYTTTPPPPPSFVFAQRKTITPTPAPPQVEQMQAPADTPTATSGISFSQWRAMVADVVKKHPKTKHKNASVQSRTATRVATELTAENTTEQIHEYLSKIFAN